MKNPTRSLVLAVAFLGMGFTMPSCPGQKEMQQEIDLLRTAHTDLSKKLQTVTDQMTALNADMAQVKQLLPQITNVIEAQKGTFDRLEASIKELQFKTNKNGFKKKK